MLIRSICLIRGGETIPKTGNSPPGEGYRCGSRGAYFVLPKAAILFYAFPSASGQTRKVGRFKQASLLAWMNITTWLQGREPRESNKLFDLFPPHQRIRSIRPIRLIRGKNRIQRTRKVYSCLSPCDGCKDPAG